MLKKRVWIPAVALAFAGLAAGCGASETIDTGAPQSAPPSVGRSVPVPPDGTKWSVKSAGPTAEKFELSRKTSAELRSFASAKMGIKVGDNQNPIEVVPADRVVQLLEAASLGQIPVGKASCSVDVHAYPEALEKVAVIDGAKRLDDTSWFGDLKGASVYYGVHPSGVAVAAVCTGETTANAIREAVNKIEVTK